MEIIANSEKINNEDNEMDYMFCMFLKDLRDGVKPLLVPSLEFLAANAAFNEEDMFYSVDSNNNLSITERGLEALKLAEERCLDYGVDLIIKKL